MGMCSSGCEIQQKHAHKEGGNVMVGHSYCWGYPTFASPPLLALAEEAGEGKSHVVVLFSLKGHYVSSSPLVERAVILRRGCWWESQGKG